MAIPRAVREAAEKAEALHKQVYENQAEEVIQPQPPAEPEPQTTPAVDPDPQLPNSDASAVAPPSELPDQQKKDDQWEHRYKVIEGKYRAEVPRLAADNRELRQKLDALSQELESMKSQASKPNSSLINQEDREKYGDDLLDVMKRAAQEQVSSKDQEIAELKRRLDEVNSTTNRNVEVGFYDQLGRLAPDWVTINSDDNFLRWLDEYDELTGKTRQDLLSEAEASRDAERVARFFSKWKATQQQHVATSNKALESQVVPDSNRVVTAPAGKRFFTRQDIVNFYAAARRGEISSKDMVAMESEIHAATIEGRIR
jgi:hypothetical protein